MYDNSTHIDHDCYAQYKCLKCNSELYSYCNSTGDKLYCDKCRIYYQFDDPNLEFTGKFYEMGLKEITEESPRFKFLTGNKENKNG